MPKKLKKDEFEALFHDIEDIVDANMDMLATRLVFKDYCKMLKRLEGLMRIYVEGNCGYEDN